MVCRDGGPSVMTSTGIVDGGSTTSISPVVVETFPRALSSVTRGITPSRRLLSSTTATGQRLSTDGLDELHQRRLARDGFHLAHDGEEVRIRPLHQPHDVAVAHDAEELARPSPTTKT